MQTFKTVLLIVASLAILWGYLRFITDDHGNIDLDNYRFTGGLAQVMIGLLEGTKDILRCHWIADAISALIIYVGIVIFYIGIKI